MKDNSDNIMMGVRNRFPEGSTEFNPGSDRDWIFNVYGKTPAADPFHEDAPREPVPELVDEPTAATAAPEASTLACKLQHPSKGVEIPKVWKPMKPGEGIGSDDFGNKPIDW